MPHAPGDAPPRRKRPGQQTTRVEFPSAVTGPTHDTPPRAPAPTYSPGRVRGSGSTADEILRLGAGPLRLPSGQKLVMPHYARPPVPPSFNQAIAPPITGRYQPSALPVQQPVAPTASGTLTAPVSTDNGIPKLSRGLTPYVAPLLPEAADLARAAVRPITTAIKSAFPALAAEESALRLTHEGTQALLHGLGARHGPPEATPPAPLTPARQLEQAHIAFYNQVVSEARKRWLADPATRAKPLPGYEILPQADQDQIARLARQAGVDVAPAEATVKRPQGRTTRPALTKPKHPGEVIAGLHQAVIMGIDPSMLSPALKNAITGAAAVLSNDDPAAMRRLMPGFPETRFLTDDARAIYYSLARERGVEIRPYESDADVVYAVTQSLKGHAHYVSSLINNAGPSFANVAIGGPAFAASLGDAAYEAVVNHNIGPAVDVAANFVGQYRRIFTGPKAGSGVPILGSVPIVGSALEALREDPVGTPAALLPFFKVGGDFAGRRVGFRSTGEPEVIHGPQSTWTRTPDAPDVVPPIRAKHGQQSWTREKPSENIFTRPVQLGMDVIARGPKRDRATGVPVSRIGKALVGKPGSKRDLVFGEGLSESLWNRRQKAAPRKIAQDVAGKGEDRLYNALSKLAKLEPGNRADTVAVHFVDMMLGQKATARDALQFVIDSRQRHLRDLTKTRAVGEPESTFLNRRAARDDVLRNYDELIKIYTKLFQREQWLNKEPKNAREAKRQAKAKAEKEAYRTELDKQLSSMDVQMTGALGLDQYQRQRRRLLPNSLTQTGNVYEDMVRAQREGPSGGTRPGPTGPDYQGPDYSGGPPSAHPEGFTTPSGKKRRPFAFSTRDRQYGWRRAGSKPEPGPLPQTFEPTPKPPKTMTEEQFQAAAAGRQVRQGDIQGIQQPAGEGPAPHEFTAQQEAAQQRAEAQQRIGQPREPGAPAVPPLEELVPELGHPDRVRRLIEDPAYLARAARRSYKKTAAARDATGPIKVPERWKRVIENAARAKHAENQTGPQPEAAPPRLAPPVEGAAAQPKTGREAPVGSKRRRKRNAAGASAPEIVARFKNDEIQRIVEDPDYAAEVADRTYKTTIVSEHGDVIARNVPRRREGDFNPQAGAPRQAPREWLQEIKRAARARHEEIKAAPRATEGPPRPAPEPAPESRQVEAPKPAEEPPKPKRQARAASPEPPAETPAKPPRAGRGPSPFSREAIASTVDRYRAADEAGRAKIRAEVEALKPAKARGHGGSARQEGAKRALLAQIDQIDSAAATVEAARKAAEAGTPHAPEPPFPYTHEFRPPVGEHTAAILEAGKRPGETREAFIARYNKARAKDLREDTPAAAKGEEPAPARAREAAPAEPVKTERRSQARPPTPERPGGAVEHPVVPADFPKPGERVKVGNKHFTVKGRPVIASDGKYRVLLTPAKGADEFHDVTTVKRVPAARGAAPAEPAKTEPAAAPQRRWAPLPVEEARARRLADEEAAAAKRVAEEPARRAAQSERDQLIEAKKAELEPHVTRLTKLLHEPGESRLVASWLHSEIQRVGGIYASPAARAMAETRLRDLFGPGADVSPLLMRAQRHLTIGQIETNIRDMAQRRLEALKRVPGYHADDVLTKRANAAEWKARIAADEKLASQTQADIAGESRDALVDRYIAARDQIARDQGTHFAYGPDMAPAREAAQKRIRENQRLLVEIAKKLGVSGTEIENMAMARKGTKVTLPHGEATVYPTAHEYMDQPLAPEGTIGRKQQDAAAKRRDDLVKKMEARSKKGGYKPQWGKTPREQRIKASEPPHHVVHAAFNLASDALHFHSIGDYRAEADVINSLAELLHESPRAARELVGLYEKRKVGPDYPRQVGLSEVENIIGVGPKGEKLKRTGPKPTAKQEEKAAADFAYHVHARREQLTKGDTPTYRDDVLYVQNTGRAAPKTLDELNAQYPKAAGGAPGPGEKGYTPEDDYFSSDEGLKEYIRSFWQDGQEPLLPDGTETMHPTLSASAQTREDGRPSTWLTHQDDPRLVHPRYVAADTELRHATAPKRQGGLGLRPGSERVRVLQNRANLAMAFVRAEAHDEGRSPREYVTRSKQRGKVRYLQAEPLPGESQYIPLRQSGAGSGYYGGGQGLPIVSTSVRKLVGSRALPFSGESLLRGAYELDPAHTYAAIAQAYRSQQFAQLVREVIQTQGQVPSPGMLFDPRRYVVHWYGEGKPPRGLSRTRGRAPLAGKVAAREAIDESLASSLQDLEDNSLDLLGYHHDSGEYARAHPDMVDKVSVIYKQKNPYDPAVTSHGYAVMPEGEGFYLVPRPSHDILLAEAGRAIEQAPKALRFAQNATSKWRTLALFTRPAWLVNNIFGNTPLVMISGATTEMLRDISRATANQLGKPWGRAPRKGLEVPPGVKYRGLWTAYAGRQGVRPETFGTKYAIKTRIQALEAPTSMRELYKWARLPWDIGKQVATLIKDANIALENAQRQTIGRAQIRRMAKRQAAGRRNLVAANAVLWGRRLKGQWKQVNADIARHMQNIATDPRAADVVLRSVTDFLGNFQHGVPHPWWDVITPFWRWTAFVTRLTLHTLPVRYPGRASLLAMASNLGAQASAQQGEVPSRFIGALRFGGPADKALLFKTAANWPIATLGDWVEARPGEGPGFGGFGASLNPLVNIVDQTLQGQSFPFGTKLTTESGGPAGWSSGNMVTTIRTAINAIQSQVPLVTAVEGRGKAADNTIFDTIGEALGVPGVREKLDPKRGRQPAYPWWLRGSNYLGASFEYANLKDYGTKDFLRKVATVKLAWYNEMVRTVGKPAGPNNSWTLAQEDAIERFKAKNPRIRALDDAQPYADFLLDHPRELERIRTHGNRP